MTDLTDVAIIGGGPAGLTAADTLARQLHTAVVFDSKTYRNAKATHMHMVPGWENKSPQAFRSSTRSDIMSGYSSVQFADVEVTKTEKRNDAHFILSDADAKEWAFRKVILAVGSSDSYPNIKGYAELWAKRIFHCLFCHGYEDRGASSVGVLAVFPIVVSALVIHMAENAAQLSDTITICTQRNEELAAQLRPVGNSGFGVGSRRIECPTRPVSVGFSPLETVLPHIRLSLVQFRVAVMLR
ncbi:hypothetical protein GGR55DRAFT_622119 [Xylaria sp. FL0064]|nr:hypothetical protein GGR55DRAFT_622119 [Xylaria sp. FL0064]